MNRPPARFGALPRARVASAPSPISYLPTPMKRVARARVASAGNPGVRSCRPPPEPFLATVAAGDSRPPGSARGALPRAATIVPEAS
jgi:hypothetical protein